jgi:hypothetical protein
VKRKVMVRAGGGDLRCVERGSGLRDVGVDVSGIWGWRERRSLSFALLRLGVQRAEVGWMAD